MNEAIGMAMVAVAVIGFWCTVSYQIARYMADRGYPFVGVLALGLFATPVISGILALALPDRSGA